MSWLHAVIDVPTQAKTAADFWAGVLGWPVGDGWPGHPELRSFEPPAGDAYVHLQTIDGAPRVHLDLEVPDVAAARAEAVVLGSTIGTDQGTWQAMVSPGGLPFCLLPERDHTPPEPVRMAAGQLTRLVQVCIDAPRSAHEAEMAFWRSFLVGRWVPSGSPEFAGKYHDDSGAPLQLLFQRLDEPSGQVRAHLDLGTDDMTAELERQVRLGAEVVGDGRGWVPLRDPCGMTYCITENSPAQVLHRDLG